MVYKLHIRIIIKVILGKILESIILLILYKLKFLYDYLIKLCII